MDINEEFANIANAYGDTPDSDLIHIQTRDGIDAYTVTRGEWEEDIRQLTGEIISSEHTIPPTLAQLREHPTIYSSAVIEQSIWRVTKWMIHECSPIMFPVVQNGIRAAVVSARIHNLLLTDDAKDIGRTRSESHG